ncbi:MAG: hypothetical protein RIQ52_1855 [Pseudomonadota bacterium]|jgi:pilus assembly protein CpaC
MSFCLRILALLCFWPLTCQASPPDLLLPLNKGTVIQLPARTDTISVGNEAIMDIRLLDATHLYVLGHQLGSTNIILCSRKDCFHTIRVEVTHDLETLKATLHQIFPDEHPKVYSSQKSIVVSGQVSSLEKMQAIMAIAGTFIDEDAASPGSLKKTGASSVINLMQVGGPQQVMLGVTVAEMYTSLARKLKVDFSAMGTPGNFTAGAISDSTLLSALTSALPAAAASTFNPSALFFRFVGSDASVRTLINAARENGLAKVLAEPNLTTISGQDAEFVSGGEFPVPIPQSMSTTGVGGAITVQFKEFGVILKFLPVVLDTGRISLKLNISVSEISEENAISIPVGDTNTSYSIPSLTKRSAASTLELGDGQTIGIAGLISDRTRESIKKFPGLGEIPILGQLFTSQDYLRRETELVIFVTPHLARPVDAAKIRLPTDDFNEPSDSEFFWMGRTESRKPPAAPTDNSGIRSGGMRGHFGQGM